MFKKIKEIFSHFIKGEESIVHITIDDILTGKSLREIISLEMEFDECSIDSELVITAVKRNHIQKFTIVLQSDAETQWMNDGIADRVDVCPCMISLRKI